MDKRKFWLFIYIDVYIVCLAVSAFIYSGMEYVDSFRKIIAVIVMSLLLFNLFLTGKDRGLKRIYGMVIFLSAGVVIFISSAQETFCREEIFITMVTGEILVIYGNMCVGRMSHGKMKSVILEISEYNDKNRNITEYKKRISAIRHDIANHMQIISELSYEIGEYEASNIMSEVSERLNGIQLIKYCDNAVLDMALEQKTADLRERDIQVQANIQLRGMEKISCEYICCLMWLLIDNVAKRLNAKNKMIIDIGVRGETDSSLNLYFKIEGTDAVCGKNVFLKSEEMRMINKILRIYNGSAGIIVKDCRVTEAGILEVYRQL